MVYDTYSKRMKRLERGETPEVYQYDVMPEEFRKQVIYLFNTALEELEFKTFREQNSIYEITCKIFRKERGQACLRNPNKERIQIFSDYTLWHREEVKDYFLQEENITYALDVIECLFSNLRNSLHDNDDITYLAFHKALYLVKFEKIVADLNTRFQEHNLGYAFEGNQIIRKDSEMIHETIIKPALKLLHHPDFQNAEKEYYEAHEHYMNRKYKDCHVACARSLESTLKVIGLKRGWDVKENDTASKLIAYVFDNNLIPSYMQSHFTALRSCLESGVPTVRNKAGGHGSGEKELIVPPYLAEYLLGTTATTIRFLVEAHRAQPIT